jgi:predicted MFS family arabinose efflux permease
MLGALAFLHGTIHAFGVPAAYGLLPRAVHRSRLSAAIAVSSSYRTLAMFAGPALAGVVLATCPVYTAFLLNAGGYAVYLVCLRMMRLPPAGATTASGKSLYRDYVEGLRYSFGHPLIGMLLLLSFFNDGLRALTTRLLPAFAEKLFNAGPNGLAVLAGATGVGAAAASVWLSRRRKPELTGRIILWGGAVGIAATLVFITTHQPWVAVAARVVFGLAAEAALTATVILLQNNVEEAYRSRVMGLWFMVAQISNISLIAIGPLAERFGLNPPLYVFLGLAVLTLAFYGAKLGHGGLAKRLSPGAKI